MPAENLPAPTMVADMCAQHAWRCADDEQTRKHLEMAADTIRALMTRCVSLARKSEAAEPSAVEANPASVAWEFDIAEAVLLSGPDAVVAELNKDDEDPDGGTFRTLTLPCCTWYGYERDAVEVRALGKWLLQMADWLEGTR